ncbi:hypothetical protein AZE42_09546 [Rhizopogon vesiculosus]|uniref:Uncharacterized protein n=1 Tax=Rhizopogon vesiculosus TaxID=180088 RepID=A0A1J8PJN5_9AGAM|nr:hypothetical protein AZE42_09546 [Rhizopogon vesiculosus]
MPSPTSGKAPSFTGAKTELLDFLNLFKDLANSNGLTDEEKCKNIVCYVDQCTKHFWVLLPGYASRDFTDFKKSILAKYPGAEKGLSTETELMEYYYDFLPIATWLVDNKKISATQHDQYDYKDEPPAFKKVLEAGQFVFSDNAFNVDNPLTAHL